MTDNTEGLSKLDLAQRIIAALTCSDEPQLNPSGNDRRDSDIVLGTVPPHLRRLYNLLVDSDSRRELEVLHNLFWTSLDTHLDLPALQLHKKKLLPDWTVLGVPDDGRSRDDGFGDVVMIQIGGGPAERGGGIFESLFGGRRGRSH